MSERQWERHEAARGVFVYQPSPGYRFAADPVLLAGWVAEEGIPRRVLDVGTGSGIAGLLLARQGALVVGLDVQQSWQPWASRSALESGLAERYRFEHGDVRSWQGDSFDLVMSNPPYFSRGSGSIPADSQRAAARHSLHGDLDALVPAMARLAPRIALILPIRRAVEAYALLAAADRPVARSLRLEPHLVLLQGELGATSEVSEESALIEAGDHHRRVRALYAAVEAPLSSIRLPGRTENAIHTGNTAVGWEEGCAPVELTSAERST